MGQDRAGRYRLRAQALSLVVGGAGLSVGTGIVLHSLLVSPAAPWSDVTYGTLGGMIGVSGLLHLVVGVGFLSFPGLWPRIPRVALLVSWAATLAGLVPTALGVGGIGSAIFSLGSAPPSALFLAVCPVAAGLCVPLVPVWNWCDAVRARPSVDTPDRSP